MSNYGTPADIDDLLAEYYGILPPQILRDDTNALLGATVMELQGLRLQQGGPSDFSSFVTQQKQQQEQGGTPETEGTYWTNVIQVDPGRWQTYEWEFVSKEIDLRNFSDELEIAFTEPSGDHHNIVTYDAADAPVAGIPVETHKVWLASPNGSQTLDIEVWG